MSQSLGNILTQLEVLTRDRRAEWKESGRAAELVLPVGGTVVILSKNPYTELFGGGAPGPFKLSVLSESGTELASLEARQGDANYLRLKGLYELAHQQARRVDDVLEEIEKQLTRL